MTHTPIVTEEQLRFFREGFEAGVHSIRGVPEVEDREAFRNLRRRVTLSTVEAAGLSTADEVVLHKAIQEAREIGEDVLDRVVAEHLNGRIEA